MSERVRKQTRMIHPTAEASSLAHVGDGTRIWHQVQVREDARIGKNCVISKGVYIDFGASIGDRVKIQNYASIYHGATVEDRAFIGPYACLTNDRLPRAITPEGELKSDADWEVGPILVKPGYRSVFNQYTIRVKDNRKRLIEGLRAQGIGSRVYYPLPVYRQPLYRNLGYDDQLPVAEHACQEVLSLPVHPGVGPDDLANITRAVNELT